MFRKGFAIAVLLVCVAGSSFAADGDIMRREPRLRDEPFIPKLLRTLKKVVGFSDGLTLPKP